MIFLTEEDVRQRSQASSNFPLTTNERLTPAAAELLRSRNCKVILPGQLTPKIDPKTDPEASSTSPTSQPQAVPKACPADAPKEAAANPCKADCGSPLCACAGQTFLDAQTKVSKAHPRIILRGKLDSLIAQVVLIQTQFDPQNKLPSLLKTGLADLNLWLWQVLQAEVSGNAFVPQSLCGMDMETVYLVSQNPQKYLQQGHLVPDLALGHNVAQLNLLRAQVREVEVEMVKAGMDREDLLMSVNRLSSAVYVLMLLTVIAQSGRDLMQVGQK